MPHLLFRNLQAEPTEKIKQKARAHHRSLQAEVASILENSMTVQPTGFWKKTTKIREQLARSNKEFSDSSVLVREDRNR